MAGPLLEEFVAPVERKAGKGKKKSGDDVDADGGGGGAVVELGVGVDGGILHAIAGPRSHLRAHDCESQASSACA